MKLTRRAACSLALRSVLGASASLLLAGSTDAASLPKPEFRFTESYGRKLTRLRDPDGTVVFEAVERGKFELFTRVLLDGIDPTAFDAGTAITVQLEDTTFDLLLGDDPTYRPGRTSVHLVFSDTDDNGLPIVYLNITLNWTPQALTIRITGKTPDFQDPILAGFYIDDFTRRYADVSEAAITVDDTTFYFDVDYSGRVTTRTVFRGPDQEEFDISATRLHGKGFFAGIDQLGRRSQRTAASVER
jgi:hypothetical protein